MTPWWLWIVAETDKERIRAIARDEAAVTTRKVVWSWARSTCSWEVVQLRGARFPPSTPAPAQTQTRPSTLPPSTGERRTPGSSGAPPGGPRDSSPGKQPPINCHLCSCLHSTSSIRVFFKSFRVQNPYFSKNLQPKNPCKNSYFSNLQGWKPLFFPPEINTLTFSSFGFINNFTTCPARCCSTHPSARLGEDPWSNKQRTYVPQVQEYSFALMWVKNIIASPSL